MFTITSEKDLGLVNRAIKERWNVDREAIKSALMGCLQDPELAPKAAKVLIAADALDVQRQKADARIEAAEYEYRGRLIKILQAYPADELRKAATRFGIAIPQGAGTPSESNTGGGQEV
ncbi:MAG: hypothetical protein LW850_17185 [Planctomycetaceae bacterium]|nr:hypothetical protein [Planctomycetaceae bacterium]MCE2812123.1 hypothetical protein [Planctomycetaceae bacterium]